ncbi:MAG: N-acetylmuramic acid 6-phosphate etherase [Candidatus Hydrogenedens sp.]|jgi:N-acetylmuramic acid 6-phosphate etherase|nr:N-acetylmuramic acid 6-phosphate etherase [Candidatus Hydrogenedens sp.]
MTSHILVEGGGTRTRAALVTAAGVREAIHEGGPSNPAAYGVHRAANRIASLARSVLAGRPAQKTALYAGLAGAADAAVQKELARRIGEMVGLKSVFICPDLHAMLQGNTENEDAILVIAGTGAAVLAGNQEGKLIKIGGWGTVLGDEGSAYGVAVAGLRAAARAEDGLAPPTALVDSLSRGAELPDFASFASWIGQASKRDIAALAPVVIATAEEGDAQALKMVQKEASHLALRVRAAHEQGALSEKAKLLQYGGLLEGSTLFRQFFHEALTPLPFLEKTFCTRRGLDAVAALTKLESCPLWGYCWTGEERSEKQSLLPETERRDSGKALDELSPEDIVERMQEADREAVEAVGDAGDSIAAVIAHAGQCLQAGGRLIYVGAGTSGRLGVLDASECPPTFGVSPHRVVGLIAGGDRALRDSVEGAEDDFEEGAKEVAALQPDARDFVIGIAASGTTAYVAGALDTAEKAGAKTAFITSSLSSPIPSHYPIVLNTGPEVLTGSTRLKAGTAAKLVLNRISTGAMARAGLIYKGRMIGMAPANKKLRQRAIRIVSELSDTSSDESRKALEESGDSIAVAVIMLVKKMSASEAQALLEEQGGRLRDVLQA